MTPPVVRRVDVHDATELLRHSPRGVPEALDRLRREHCSGRILVLWRNPTVGAAKGVGP